MINSQKFQGNASNWFKCVRRERTLERKPRVKTWSWFKSYMDVRFNVDKLLEEKSNVVQEKIKIKEEDPVLVHEDAEPILDFDETKDEKNLVMIECFL